MWVIEGNIPLPLQPSFDAKSEVYTKLFLSNAQHSPVPQERRSLFCKISLSFLSRMPRPPFLLSLLCQKGVLPALPCCNLVKAVLLYKFLIHFTSK